MRTRSTSSTLGHSPCALRSAQRGVILLGATFMLCASCIPGFPHIGRPNPFRDLPTIPLDGVERPLTADVVPLGELSTGQVIDVTVNGDTVEAVLILIADELSDEAGVLAGGGPPETTFSYRVQRDGRYFVFVQFDPLAGPARRQGTIAVGPGDPSFAPPSRQVVRVEFAEGYLSDPGLFDPASGTQDERDLLEALSPSVADDIVDRLRFIFRDTPILIVSEHDPLPQEPFSRLRYAPDRVEAAEQDAIDVALPPPDPARPECRVRVVFGRVLSDTGRQDPGNQVLDDEAVVYVGSFQGRGETCRTAATDSIHNLVLALAQTGAHEIGHLVGLYHVEQIDIMNRSATLAFLRELPFRRGQVQIERLIGGQVVGEVFPAVIQDPDLYFETVFSPE